MRGKIERASCLNNITHHTSLHRNTFVFVTLRFLFIIIVYHRATWGLGYIVYHGDPCGLRYIVFMYDGDFTSMPNDWEVFLSFSARIFRQVHQELASLGNGNGISPTFTRSAINEWCMTSEHRFQHRPQFARR